MFKQICSVYLAAVCVAAIKVPVEPNEEVIATTAQVIPETAIPIYYTSDGANVDSYLIPPDPNKPKEVDYVDTVATPATYLLPPAPDTKNEFFYEPTEPGRQTDWYPIAATSPKQADVTPVVQEEPKVPSTDLLPPREDAPNEFVFLSLSPDLELPSEELDHMINNPPSKINMPVPKIPYRERRPVKYHVHPELVPLSYILPPKEQIPDYTKIPKRLYPKKFRPVPIPISQFVEKPLEEAPVARPVHPVKPVPHQDHDYVVPKEENNERQNYSPPQPERKHKLKKPHNKEIVSEDKLPESRPTEQETSASNFRYPEHEVYPVRTKEELNTFPKHKHNNKSKGERTEFRMHGMKGPHSYQFGYDTGKGKNRQFRYEERDNDGHVRGHYGYVDKFGKLRVVNYDADPEHGFRAEVPAEKE